MITHGSENTQQVQRYLDAHGPIPGLHLEFVEFPSLDERLLETRWCQWIVFKRWHRRALELAKRLHAELHFDLVHQVTGIAYREPGYLWQLDAPFVWGPVGGTETFPWRFLTEAGLASAASEAARNVINAVQMRFSPRVRRACAPGYAAHHGQFERPAVVRPRTRSLQPADVRCRSEPRRRVATA